MSKIRFEKFLASRALVALLCFFIAVPAMAQDEEGDECGIPTNKKVIKLLEQSKDRKKYDQRQRHDFLKQAVDLDEDCAACYFELAKASYRRAKANGTSFKGAQGHYTDVISACPEFHSDAYYYLGVIYYGQADYKNALKYFKEFLDFPDDSKEKNARDLDKKYQDVTDILKEVEFYAEFYEKPVPFNPHIVEGVSSEHDDYLAMLSPDNEIMFYTRKLEKKAKGDLVGKKVEEFTQSARENGKAPFDRGKRMRRPFNVGDNYGGVSISINNKEMFITICKPGKQGYNNCDVYVTRYGKYYNEEQQKEVYGWSEPENLGENVNTEDGWEAQPSISSDGNVLYFATYRATSDGMDIFYTERDEEGNWSVAKSVGAPINGAGHEKAPFMHSDSQTLYFASSSWEDPATRELKTTAGRFGAGGYDIYYTKRKDDGTWTDPKNIGYPINTKEDEHGLFVSTDGKLAYFGSNRLKGSKGLDIYSFELYKEARPEKIALFKGELKDDNGEVLKDAKIEFKVAESNEVQQVKVDSTDGSYAAVVNLKEGKDVVMTVKAKDHAYNSRIFKFDDLFSSTVTKKNVKAEKIKVGKTYKINDILFKSNSAEIEKPSKQILDGFADYLKENPKLKVAIEGHTDNVGDPGENMVLSTDRAFSVMEYLQEKGVKASRLSFKGYGETKPVGDNTSENGRALNRRTEFKIISR